MDFFQGWFEGFGEGLENLSDEECSRLFHPCAVRCAEDAMADLYRGIWADCGNDLDEFFRRLHEAKGIDGEIITPGSVYDILFLACECDLHTCWKVNTDKLCVCSRQSVLSIMNAIAGEKAVAVEKVSSILSGDPCCRFRVTIQNKSDM